MTPPSIPGFICTYPMGWFPVRDGGRPVFIDKRVWESATQDQRRAAMNQWPMNAFPVLTQVAK